MRNLQDFIAAAEPVVANWSSAPSALEACARLVRDFAASGVLRESIARELAAIAGEPTRTPSRSASTHLWVLWGASRGGRLAVSRIHRGVRDESDYLADAPSYRFLTPLDAEPLEVELYEQCATEDEEVMSKDDALTPRGPRTLHPGEVLTVRPRRDILHVPDQTRDRHLLSFDGPRFVTQQWVYDFETRKPVYSVAADPHDARLEGAMRLLHVLGHQDATDVIARLASHEAHFVRWAAIRHVTGLDADVGIRLLEAATTDAHPHVRASAQRALERLRES
jgi:hypothetical protein